MDQLSLVAAWQKAVHRPFLGVAPGAYGDPPRDPCGPLVNGLFLAQGATSPEANDAVSYLSSWKRRSSKDGRSQTVKEIWPFCSRSVTNSSITRHLLPGRRASKPFFPTNKSHSEEEFKKRKSCKFSKDMKSTKQLDTALSKG